MVNGRSAGAGAGTGAGAGIFFALPLFRPRRGFSRTDAVTHPTTVSAVICLHHGMAWHGPHNGEEVRRSLDQT